MKESKVISNDLRSKRMSKSNHDRIILYPSITMPIARLVRNPAPIFNTINETRPEKAQQKKLLKVNSLLLTNAKQRVS